MKQYKVTWAIDSFEDSPEAAAKEALKIMQDPESWATVFNVIDFDSGKEVEIDLCDETIHE